MSTKSDSGLSGAWSSANGGVDASTEKGTQRNIAQQPAFDRRFERYADLSAGRWFRDLILFSSERIAEVSKRERSSDLALLQDHDNGGG